MAQKRGLGKGIGALLGDNPTYDMISAANAADENVSRETLELPIIQIDNNPDQPRRTFDEEALNELASSLKLYGMIQPIVVRPGNNGRYTIISGERRWRAAKLAKMSTVPVIIRDVEDQTLLELALVENIQREDLNAIEIALAYEHLLDADGMTQEKVSERVGKSRTAIANYLRLLRLPAQVQIALQKKEIDMGHARALLAIDSPSLQIKLFNEVLKNGYSVRKVEEMAQMLKNGEDVNSGTKKIVAKAKLPEEYNALRSHLSEFLQTKVQLTCSPKGKGKITIPFANEEELEHIMAVFDKMK